jgi:hypothetical protein
MNLLNYFFIGSIRNGFSKKDHEFTRDRKSCDCLSHPVGLQPQADCQYSYVSRKAVVPPRDTDGGKVEYLEISGFRPHSPNTSPAISHPISSDCSLLFQSLSQVPSQWGRNSSSSAPASASCWRVRMKHSCGT